VKIDCVEGDPGQTIWVPVLVRNGVDIGGFDLVLEYFNTELTVISVERGSAINSVDGTGKYDWHYFTYRLDPSTVIHKFKVHLIGIGRLYHYSDGICLTPNLNYVELVRMKVVLSPDANLRCLQTPIFFEWDDYTCLENMFSDCTGNALYVSNNPAQFDTVDCPAEDKNQEIIPCVTFENGCVKFRCPEDVDPVVIGDINVNGTPYDIGDAVLFASYFIQGESVFSTDYDTRQAQIGGSDINRDGYVLTVADLVYLLRIISGDQEPLGEGTGQFDATYTGQGFKAAYDGSKLQITTENALGAALFIFEGEGKVSPLIDGVTLQWGAQNGETRVLIYGMGKAKIPTGTTQVCKLEGEVKLTKVEAADYYAHPIEMEVINTAGKVLPTSYGLSQNYPNPFNATTQISFSMVDNGRVGLKIYNLAGQLVKEYDQFMSAGYRSITWDGTNIKGDKVASGIYFYKLDVNGFSEIKKMTLLK
ncbi:MAG: T9SS type A sorting domain-containing protein, partial [candidate division Zixibacteria bacterium]|nr:T9SS type A sorting domain-containing protein [candidate division Zixibacteria bacterium]